MYDESSTRSSLQSLLPRAYYASSISEFITESSDTVLGRLAKNSEFAVEPDQRDAWLTQIEILKVSVNGLVGMLFLEFNIPRMGKRIDAVLIAEAVVFVIEFKVGEKEYTRADLEQVWDYCLDLKNFHEASHKASIIPILVATEAVDSDRNLPPVHEDGVYSPVKSNCEDLRTVIDMALQSVSGDTIDGPTWGAASYHPTPTIIEAAQALYAKHSVDDIDRREASVRNLRITSQYIENLVDEAQRHGRKVICLVTGVPGAGKTLVGLNIATKRRDPTTPTHAVFLSGNGPLVAVLREALTRDEFARQKKVDNGKRVKKGVIGEKIKAFIQNVHHFRDEALREHTPPIDHVVIFDEAQRAWNQTMTANFMRRKKNQPDFSQSEPEFLISYLNRHKDWAVIVCLVGGGQEINTGEAGIGAWLEALNTAFPDWHIYISPELKDSEYAAGHALEAIGERKDVYFNRDLHLAVSMRSFRAENVSAFVKAVLDCEVDGAREAFAKLSARYPMAITRDLMRAKQWIREHARGSERYGLVASSSAHRLKPHAIDIRVETNPVHWFLNDRTDTRSSFYLEDAATEFQVQGLEVDWACITWDADLRFTGCGWSHHSFRGSGWDKMHKEERKKYLRNAYRVLLTRARQGMVIFVPPGESDDPTRDSSFYDSTFNYLQDVGIPVLDACSK